MPAFFQSPVSCDPHALLGPLRALTGQGRGLEISCLGRFATAAGEHAIERVRLRGPAAGHDPIRVGLFAGLHGDEPAGCAALVELVRLFAAHPHLATGYDLFVYPVVNPTGCRAGTRANHAGLDLNREFWRGSAQPEVQLLEAELRLQRFHGLITLHADDTCEGVYGYAHGRTLNEALLEPALRAAQRFLPCDPRPSIDGFAARQAMIHDCFHGVLSAPCEQTPRPFDVIFETPAHAPLDLQIEAGVAAVRAMLASYPGFIAYAQDL